MLHEDLVYRRPASKYIGKWLSNGELRFFISVVKESSYQGVFLTWQNGEKSTLLGFQKPYLFRPQQKWTANYGGQIIPQPPVQNLRTLIKSLFNEHTYRFIRNI
jgi:hypothetical protein